MTGIPGLTGDLILDHAFGLLLVLGRVGATFALMPGLGEATVPAQIKGGMITVPEKPGLGIEIDPAQLEAAHQLYLTLPTGSRDDAVAMQFLIPGWKFDHKKPCMVR